MFSDNIATRCGYMFADSTGFGCDFMSCSNLLMNMYFNL